MVRFRSFYFCFSLLLIVEFQQEKALYKRNAGNVKVVALIARRSKCKSNFQIYNKGKATLISIVVW